MKPPEGNIIKDKSYSFALEIIKLSKYLYGKNEFVFAKQVLRSGTSIGANINEAVAASSRKDFLNKMTIASKEARETENRLDLLKDSNIMEEKFFFLVEDISEINKILTSIVKTTKESL